MRARKANGGNWRLGQRHQFEPNVVNLVRGAIDAVSSFPMEAMRLGYLSNRWYGLIRTFAVY